MTDPQLLLVECEVPESAFAGSTFHLELDGRYFVVITPEGALPGQTINVLVPSPEAEIQSSACIINEGTNQETLLRAIKDATVRTSSHIKALDDAHSISKKISFLSSPVLQRWNDMMSHYKIGGTFLFLDDKCDISVKFQQLGSAMSNVVERLFAYAREVDQKLSLSFTAARLLRTAFDATVAFDQRYKVSGNVAWTLGEGITFVAERIAKYSERPFEKPVVPAVTESSVQPQ